MSKYASASPEYRKWLEHVDTIGKEKAVEELVQKLRELASHIESGEYPVLMMASDEVAGPMRTISVTVSNPWGG